MNRLTTTDLNNFHRHALGADRFINRVLESIETQSTSQQTNYPPFNIIKYGDNVTEVQIAVAGFSLDELEVKIDNGSLVITGEKPTQEKIEGVEYVHHGISARRFIRSWTLAENVEVLGADVKDGILSVKIKRLNPDSAKPKTIPITYAGDPVVQDYSVTE
jgi:molecular chaperone IbpA